MKRIVSVSLGSSRRDHSVQAELAGESFEISRRGTDGDLEKAIQLVKELDGKVDAIGLGGIDIFLSAGKKKYAHSDGLRLMHAAKETPVVDGSGLKDTLEWKAVLDLKENTNYINTGTRVLMVSAVDRYGMAQAFCEAGCNVVFGDAIFALNIPLPIKSLRTLEALARTMIPVLVKLPFRILYPTGSSQRGQDTGSRVEKFARFYYSADVIAGDFHYIRKYFPPRLDNKIIVTNTTTSDDVKFLQERGVSTLITTTPVLDGRSFGTNVMEGVLVAMAGKPWAEITGEEYNALLDKVGFKPQITHLQDTTGTGTA